MTHSPWLMNEMEKECFHLKHPRREGSAISLDSRANKLKQSASLNMLCSDERTHEHEAPTTTANGLLSSSFFNFEQPP